jgi:malonyl-CoA/methylmalonyl-CoA synthetase
MSWLNALRAAWRPDRTALVTPEATLTFADLEVRVARAAGWLHQQGVRPGDTVALQVPRSLAFLEVHLAALGAGACTLPLNPAYTAEELAVLLADARPALTVAPAATAATLGDRAGGRPYPAEDLREALDRAPAAPTDAAWPDATPAVLLYTSGTTGRPKGAVIRHGNLAATVGALREAWAFRDTDVLVHALPLFHVHGLFVAQHQALLAGARTVWMPRFDPAEAFAAIAAHGATVFMGVPTFYARFLALPAHVAPDLRGMRLFTSGSAPLPARDHERFARRFGHAILERYGMTEIGIVLSNPLHGERRPGTVGFPLRDVRARIVTESGVEASTDEVGELWIAGPSVFSGYLNLPEATAAAFAGPFLRTGDLARRDADGYFRIVGRKTEMILSGGLNVYPAEVEAALCAEPGVLEAAVVGVPDPDLGERVVASVVAEPGVEPARVLASLRERLAAYKCPRALELVATLPRNALGKVQKGPLKARWDTLVVEPATPADLDVLAANNVAMARETEGIALDPATVRRGVGRILAGEVPASYLVARRAGQVVGQCMITREWSDWRDAEVWWFQSVWVPPTWRRHGVFRALFDAVSDRARASGAAGLRLYVDRRNVGAQQTYRRLGMNDEHYRTFELMFHDLPDSPETP